MVKSMYAGVSGLRAHQQKMDVIGNNIANVNTFGFKTASYAFRDAVYQTITGSSGGTTGVGGLGGVNASQVGYGAGAGSITASFVAGGKSSTGLGMDCVIDGTGFFIVGPRLADASMVRLGDPLAGSGLSLSRVGMLTTDNEGYLTDADGNYVYGIQSGTNIINNAAGQPETYIDGIRDANANGKIDIGEYLTKTNTSADANNDGKISDAEMANVATKLTPIRVPTYVADPAYPDKTAYSLQNYKINNDGTVVGVDKDTKKAVVIGQIALAAVDNPNGLEKTTGYYYGIGDNAGSVTAGRPNGGSVGSIESGFLELSNVDLAKEFAEMITTQRGFQANSKIITVSDEMLEQLVNMKR
ncbi:MAG: flagellar hook-basal body complex protein [Lachnospiraceae bacterium]